MHLWASGYFLGGVCLPGRCKAPVLDPDLFLDDQKELGPGQPRCGFRDDINQQKTPACAGVFSISNLNLKSSDNKTRSHAVRADGQSTDRSPLLYPVAEHHRQS